MNRRLLLLPVLFLLLVLFVSVASAMDDPLPRDLDALRDSYDRAALPESALANAPAAAGPATVPPSDAAPRDADVDHLVPWSELAIESGRSGRWAIYRMKPNFSELVPAAVSASYHNMSPSLRPRGANRLLYVSLREDNYDIYSSLPDGSDEKRLTDYRWDDLMPTWSPDGTQIAFQSERTGGTDIYVMNADGSGLRQLTTAEQFDGHPTWSPSGQQIAFTSQRTGRYQIWVMNADGSGQRLLTDHYAALYPAWSPDGRTIAFSGLYSHQPEDPFLDIILMDADGGRQRYFGGSMQRDAVSISWSPDGTHVAYILIRFEVINNMWQAVNSFLHVGSFDGVSVSPVLMYDHDPLVLAVNWASRDAQPPGPCAMNAPAARAWRSAYLTWSATDALSGVAGYDVEWRRAGTTAWQTVPLPRPKITFMLDERAAGEVIEYRCRAVDASFNRADWATAPVKRTIVDGSPPRSTIARVTPVDGDTVRVEWRGRDTGGGIASYDIWVRQGSGGDWTRWQRATTAVSAEFTGQSGQTYAFRSQAIDHAGLREPWRPSPQAERTLGVPDEPTGAALTARVLLPMTTAYSGLATASESPSIADWPTVGGNPGHTGINAGDPGASRYARVWSTELQNYGPRVLPQQVTIADGVIMLALEDGYPFHRLTRVVAVNAETGIAMWDYTPLDSIRNPPTIAHGAAYFTDYTWEERCALLAVDLHTGREIWRTTLSCSGHSHFQHPLVVGNRIYVAARYHVQEVLAATARPGWSTNGGDTSGGWAPAYDNGRIYWRSSPSSIGVVEAASGRSLWEREVHEATVDATASPVVSGAALASANYGLVALNLQQQRPFWTKASEPGNYFNPLTMPALAEGVVYALRGPALVAYNLYTGAEMWRFTADKPLLAAPVIAGKYVYVASASHTYVLNRRTRQLEWDVPVGGVLSLANGHLYIAETIYEPTTDTPMKAILHAYRAQEP